MYVYVCVCVCIGVTYNLKCFNNAAELFVKNKYSSGKKREPADAGLAVLGHLA